MSSTAPTEASIQISQACELIERYLGSALLAVYVYGSAIDGGLKPYSDIDTLVAVDSRLDETVRQALLRDLLKVSAPPGTSEALRALEVTVVAHSEVAPWRYPARREMQFGEWLRNDILAGRDEPPVYDPDLAILLTTARRRSIAMYGPPAANLFAPVPERDFYQALAETVNLWESAPDWEGDERNVVLTLARIWYSAMTGQIAPKDVAADWAMPRLPLEYQSVLFEARQSYLGCGESPLALRADQMTEFVLFVKTRIRESPGFRGA